MALEGVGDLIILAYSVCPLSYLKIMNLIFTLPANVFIFSRL